MRLRIAIAILAFGFVAGPTWATDGPDARETGTTGGPDQVGASWQPPACDGALPPDVATPTEPDAGAWTPVLDEALKALQATEQKWRAAETGAAVPAYDTGNRTIRQIQRGRFIQEARDAYSAARCTLFGLLAQARRTGVEPGVLRAYEVETPANGTP